LLGFSKSLREDLKNTRIKVTDILPESVNTSSWEGIDAPKDKFIQPNEIALIISNIIKLENSLVEIVKIKNTD
jgi:short-subunit dehydrogenase